MESVEHQNSCKDQSHCHIQAAKCFTAAAWDRQSKLMVDIVILVNLPTEIAKAIQEQVTAARYSVFVPGLYGSMQKQSSPVALNALGCVPRRVRKSWQFQSQSTSAIATSEPCALIDTYSCLVKGSLVQVCYHSL